MLDPVLLHELLKGAALEAGAPVALEQRGEAQQQGNFSKALVTVAVFLFLICSIIMNWLALSIPSR